MRIRTGHGPDDWTESVASTPGTFTLRGTLSFSGPGSVELARIAGARKRPTTPEERHAAYERTKRYRQRQRDVA